MHNVYMLMPIVVLCLFFITWLVMYVENTDEEKAGLLQARIQADAERFALATANHQLACASWEVGDVGQMPGPFLPNTNNYEGVR